MSQGTIRKCIIVRKHFCLSVCFLKDENPYVRKTAAVCVAKLYDLNPELAMEQDFVSAVLEMVSDVNPMVVANAVIALTDINEASPNKNIFEIDTNTSNKLLHALNECTE